MKRMRHLAGFLSVYMKIDLEKTANSLHFWMDKVRIFIKLLSGAWYQLKSCRPTVPHLTCWRRPAFTITDSGSVYHPPAYGRGSRLLTAESDQGSVPTFPSGCRLTAPPPPPSSLSPLTHPVTRSPACVLCNILIGRFVRWGRVKGRGPEYCDLTISCFVRSTNWSEDQLEAAINGRKTCSGQNRIKERRGDKLLQMLWSETSV